VSDKNAMTEEEVRRKIKDIEYINWIEVSTNVKLSEDFIKEYARNVWWIYISKYQALSEELIREYTDKVWWTYISEHQTLSNEFILKHIDVLDPYLLLENNKLNLSPQIKAMCQLKIL
jgi:hypothetical protein